MKNRSLTVLLLFILIFMIVISYPFFSAAAFTNLGYNSFLPFVMNPLSEPTPIPTIGPTIAPTSPPANCSPAYPDFCIPPPPPDLDCKDIPQKRFTVLPPDPHNFDSDQDGIGCET